MKNVNRMKNINYDLVLNKPLKPRNNEQLGYFLAGLIDADGHITVKGHEITINSHIRDIGVMRYIKKIVGGSIYRYKKVNACRYMTNQKGLRYLSVLILNKLKLSEKVKQFNLRLAPRIQSGLCKTNNLPDIQRNHWFAGFVQGDGSFQIKIRKPGRLGWRHQVEIVLSIELKQQYILKQIQATFGGHVGYRKSRHTYYYSSVNLKNASKLMAYFDKYQVMGPNYRLYLCWKRALTIVLEKQHHTDSGFEEIQFLKGYMTQLRNTS